MPKRVFLAALLMFIALALRGENWLTIYNEDLSLVRSSFELNLMTGRQDYNFDDIPHRIMPASVIVSSQAEGFQVAEQNYEYDLAGKVEILRKYLNSEVEITTKDGSRIRGILKFSDYSSYGIQDDYDGRLYLVSAVEAQMIQLASLPENFYTRPTLRWSLIAPQAGKYPLQLSYLTGGLSWDVTYNGVWNDSTLALNSWVTIKNTSGKAFEDINLKLIAGDVNVVKQLHIRGGRANEINYSIDGMSATGGAPSFAEKSFHDYHMYSLDQKLSFANNQTKQLALYPMMDIKAEGIYEYPTWTGAVNSIIQFKNTEANGIGKPLPKGSLKIYREDTDGNLEFIGEDSIKHTGRNEEVKITTGKAFDLVASTLSKDQTNVSKKVTERTVQVTLRNNSSQTRIIRVVHQMSGNTRIIQHDLTPEIDSDNKATFSVEVKADAQVIFSFRERSES